MPEEKRPHERTKRRVVLGTAALVLALALAGSAYRYAGARRKPSERGQLLPAEMRDDERRLSSRQSGGNSNYYNYDNNNNNNNDNTHPVARHI
jgi:hypothetical protein